MTKRTVNVENIDQVHLPTRGAPPLRMRYVSKELDGSSPFSGILFKEIRDIERKTRMTDWQAVVWEWNLVMLSVSDIAEVFGRDESTIRQHLEVAQQKALHYPRRGLLTNMIETLGYRAVQEVLMERLDSMVPSHPMARKLTRKAYEARQKYFEDQERKRLKSARNN